IGRDDFEVIVGRMRESAFAVTVAERPDSWNVRFKPIVHDDVSALVARNASGVEPQIIGIRPTANREEQMGPVDRRTAVFAVDMSGWCVRLSTDPDATGVQAETDTFTFEDVLNRRRDVRILMLDEPGSHLDDGDLGSESAKHLAEFQTDVAA